MGEMKHILGCLLVAGGICGAQAQNAVDITGTVSDAVSGNAVAGAKVYLAGTPGVTTTTGGDGSFHLTGSAVGVRSGLKAGQTEMAFRGTELSFSLAAGSTPVSVDVYNLKSELVRNVVSQKAAAGRYTVNAAPAGLAAGLYIVRARVGNQSAAFKMSTIGVSSHAAGLLANAAFFRAALSKSAADPIDTLKIEKDGYKNLSKSLTKYTGIFPINLNPKLPPGDLKIVSERSMPQVRWGSNVDVQVWDGGTQLKGDYKTGPFEGPTSWLITFGELQPYNAWGFVAKETDPEDMSAWKDGSMHLAVKGTATSVGVTMASVDQAGGLSKKVDLRNYGYKPDNQWHEANVPLSDFEGTDFANITVYCGLVYPVTEDTALFDASLFYQVDDIYWKLTK
jgi:hypothetical protein